MKKLLITVTCFLLLFQLQAQQSEGGTPLSFNPKVALSDTNIPSIDIRQPDLVAIQAEDEVNERDGGRLRFAVLIPTQLNLQEHGQWFDLPNGDRVWKLRIAAPNAQAISLQYSQFFLPKGSKMYIYNENKTDWLGAFTSINNKSSQEFATGNVMGDVSIIEYYEPAAVRGQGIINIGNIGYAYRHAIHPAAARDFCEVDINCSPEGDDWQDIKRSVVRILISQGGGLFWCTGSLMNNTSQNCTPYVLTALHCGDGSTTSDFNQYIFYFNYESTVCNGMNAPTNQSMVGCTRRADSADGGGAQGSDFLLVEINNDIPESYNAYLNGWNANDVSSPSGVGIHHPAGEQKKISTYTSNTASASWNGVPGTHWLLNWIATPNGHGVTEGGSSGSPLFDNNGRVVGQLTGGSSFCDSPNNPDLYGKMSYNWTENPNPPNEKLNQWLDPDNTGTRILDGTYAANCGLGVTANTNTQTACPSNSTEYVLTLSSAANTSASFSASGLPTGASASFSPNSASPGGSVTLTVNLNSNVNEGSYDFTVTATGGGISSDMMLNLVVISGSPSMPDAIAPVDGAMIENPTVFSWTDSGEGITYEIEIASDDNFSNIVEMATTTSPSYFTSVLLPSSTYYWRVRSINACTESNYTDTRTLTTNNVECFVFENTSVLNISANGTPFLSSDLDINEDFEIADASIELDIEHTWVGDLEVTLNSPSGANIQVFSRPGEPVLNDFGCNQDNIRAVFTDAALNSYNDFENTCNLSEGTTTTAIAGVYQSDSPMSAVDNTNSSGTWTLNLSDAEDQDGGRLVSWTLHLCRTSLVALPSITNNEALTVVNSETETIDMMHLLTQDDNSTAAEIVYILNSVPQFGTLLLNGVPLANGQTFTQEDINDGLLTYEHDGSASDTDSFNFDVLNAGGGTLSGNIFNIIIETPALTAAAQLEMGISCTDFNDAQVSVLAQGGVPPYAYSVNGGNVQDSDFFFDLAAGTYDFSVIDNAGTEVSAGSIMIDNPPAISVSTEVFQNDLTVTASGGTGSLTYSIDGQNYQTDNTFLGLANGTYTVSVQDENDCIESISVTIDFSTLTAILVLEQAISCFAAQDAVLSIQIMGGMPPFQYRLNSGDFQDANVFADIGSGNHIGDVIDSEGTIVMTQALLVEEPPQIEVEVDVVDDEVTINATGGTGQLEYSLNGLTFTMNNVFSDVPNGDYTAIVRDGNDCTVSIMVTVANNSIIALAILDNDISCFSADDAQISVAVDGGVPPYQYSLNSGGFQDSNVFSDLAPGVYTVRVIDSEGFIRESNQITVTNPEALDITPAVNDDMITVFANGGTGALTYSVDGINFQDSNVFENLDNGDYTVTVMDENGCTAEANATIGVNDLAVIANLDNDITCTDDNDAQITVLVQGGTPGYVYSLNDGPFQNENVFSDLGAGEYTITVMDTEGFIRNSNLVTVTNPEPLIAMVEVEGNEITVNGSGGSGLIEYSFEGGPFSTENVFSDLDFGTYEIVIRDANGCTIIRNVTIGAEDLLVVAVLVNGIDCPNDNNAEITAEVQGGVPDYIYRLNDGEFQASPTFSNLDAGNYVITVMDTQGALQSSNIITITNPDVITIEASTEGNTLTIIAMGGTGQLMYSIDGENFQESNIFEGLDNGTYTITVVDENGCSSTSEVPISVNDIMAVAVLNNELACFGDTDAQIVVQVMGGVQPYQFRLNDGELQSSNVFNDLGVGTYEVTVFDSEGFTRSTNTIVITNPDEIVANPVTTNSMITVNASGGTGTLMYSIDGENFQESDVFSNLDNGTYTITVLDENNCTATFEAIVALNDIMAVAVLNQEITCFGVDDAQIIVQVSGGTLPYLFSLNDGPFQESNVFNDLGSGTYTVVVRDVQGLTRNTNTIVIESPDEIIMTTTVNVSTITVEASGGTGTLTYSIDGENFQNSPVFPDLANGSYTITVMDENGCIVTSMENIGVNNLVAIAVLDQGLTCFGDATAQITVQVNGGTAPYMYKINGRPLQASPVFSDLEASTYTVTVFDNDGFTTDTQEITIVNPAMIVIDAVAFSDQITVNASGGTGNLTYSIDGENFQESNIFDNLENDDYTITVMDDNACTATATATINVLPLTATIQLDQDITCANANDGQISVVASGGIPAYQYQLNDGDLQESPVFSGLAPGIYTVTVFDSEDRMIETNSVTITNPSIIIALADSMEDSLFVQAAGGTGELMYSLDAENFQSEPFFGGLVNGLYTVTIQDENGCNLTLNDIPVVPIPLSATSIKGRDITCFNTNDGLLTVIPMGGIMPYVFSLDGENFQLLPQFSGISEGTYTPVVMDALGTIILADTHTFTNPEPVTFEAEAVGDSIVVTNASGGTAPYQYSIDDNTFQDSPVFADLPNGMYNVIVRDANACTSSTSIEVVITGLFNPIQEVQLLVYPNPSSGLFFVEIPKHISNSDWTVQVFDALGRLVKETIFEASTTLPTHRLNLNDLPAGAYHLRLWDGEKQAREVLIIE